MFNIAIDSKLKGYRQKSRIPASLLTEQTREAGWVVGVTDRSA
jgi:hypothetical protein